MSDASVQRGLARRPVAAEPRPLPLGFGLLIGAAVSLGLWIAIFWLVGLAVG